MKIHCKQYQQYLQWINSNSLDSIGRISKKEKINMATNSGDVKKLSVQHS